MVGPSLLVVEKSPQGGQDKRDDCEHVGYNAHPEWRDCAFFARFAGPLPIFDDECRPAAGARNSRQDDQRQRSEQVPNPVELGSPSMQPSITPRFLLPFDDEALGVIIPMIGVSRRLHDRVVFACF